MKRKYLQEAQLLEQESKRAGHVSERTGHYVHQICWEKQLGNLGIVDPTELKECIVCTKYIVEIIECKPENRLSSAKPIVQADFNDHTEMQRSSMRNKMELVDKHQCDETLNV